MLPSFHPSRSNPLRQSTSSPCYIPRGIAPQILADRVSAYVQAYTCYGSVRPFGVSTIVAGVDKTGPRLFCIEPSGVFYGYRGCAAGKGRALARTELEKLVNKEGEGAVTLNVRDGVNEVARMSVALFPPLYLLKEIGWMSSSRQRGIMLTLVQYPQGSRR